MTTEMRVPMLAFGKLLAALWFGVMGIRSVKKARSEGEISALGRAR